MDKWYCGCEPAKLHDMDAAFCLECRFAAPPGLARQPTEPVPDAPLVLTADETGRALGLAELLDQAVAARPAVALSPVGTGLSLLIDGLRSDAAAAYARLVSAVAAGTSAIEWIANGVPPDLGIVDRFLGPGA